MPKNAIGYLLWVFYLILIFLVVIKTWQPLPDREKNKKFLFYGLAFITPFTVVIGGFNLNGILPDQTTSNLILFLLISIPWQVAAGLLGLFPAVLIAMISGISMAWWGSHSIYSIVEFTGLALIFYLCIRQNYQDWFFQKLRNPIAAAFVTGILAFPVLVFNQILTMDGSLGFRLDTGLGTILTIPLVRVVELLIGSVFVSGLYLSKKSFWQLPKQLIPAPMERRVDLRFLLTTLPIILIIVIVVVIVDWRVAKNAAQDLIESKLAATTEVASGSLPYFFESGRNLITNISKKDLMTPDINLNMLLSEEIRETIFFNSLYVYDQNGALIGGYPEGDENSFSLSPEERTGIDLALQGVHFQIYTTRAGTGHFDIMLTFMSTITATDSSPIGVVIGRTDFYSNPYVQPAITTLNNFSLSGGEGFIVDDQRRIVYYTGQNQQLLLNEYPQELPLEQRGVTGKKPDGSNQIYYAQPVTGSAWVTVAALPTFLEKELALKIAAPLMGVLGIVLVLVLLSLQLAIKPITKSVKSLSSQASIISQGDLENPVSINSLDEVGQLAYSFEQMRLRLKDRLEEMKQLLFSSQSASKHLAIGEAINPILQALMSRSTSHVRAVLVREVSPDQEDQVYVTYGIGSENDIIQALDEQLFTMMKDQRVLPIPNLTRFKRFLIPPGEAPGALAAFALTRDSEYYGTIWIAYHQPKPFKEEEIRFLETLANQAAMAAANAQLYTTAELGRQRFEAVLNSTPDPVMVFDDLNRLILINPAAKQIVGLFNSTDIGLDVTDVIEHPDLLDLLKKDTLDRDTSREIQLTNRNIFFTTVSPVMRGSQIVGKVCLLRDITQFKEVDTFKSDIVSTVSHDLRSPLTLMRGYASMLQMVGEINEQQKSYIAKIISGVDNMSKLVNNLLDLGRIEAGIGLRLEEASPVLLAEQVVQELQPQAIQKNINLNIETQNLSNQRFQADTALIQQALYNIVENALKYNSLGGEVKVIVDRDEHNILYEITDNGIGIAPIDLPHLFEKFYRSGRREAYNQRGTGLGLAIVKTIVEKHGGKVWVESKLGRGSSFFIQIPINLN